jgi:hypothetical protein
MWEIEQKAGPPSVESVDAGQVDDCRRATYSSYEQFLRKRLHQLDEERSVLWQRDYSSVDAYLQSVESMRAKFKEMLGFWVEPTERKALEPIDEQPLLETATVIASRFTYEALPGLKSYAVRLVPKRPGPFPGLLVQHGYMGTPEMACGLVLSANDEDGSYRSFGLRAAERGYHVIAPHHPSGYGTLSDAVDVSLPGYGDHDVHYGKNRLHRLCALGGGSLLGLDMLVSSRAVDLLDQHEGVDSQRIGIYGLSRGGQTALYLPALDRRIQASVCSAYFNERLPKLIGPYSRTNYVDWFAEGQILPEQVRYFADADIVSLIAPRAFAAEAGALDGAVDQDAAGRECKRARVHYEKLDIAECCEFIAHAEGHVSATAQAFDFLGTHLNV